MSEKFNPSSFSLTTFHRIAGNLLFGVLFVYSIVYAIERVTYVDSAWLFFHGVNTESFSCTWERFSAFISEIPLYTAVKLHLPFKALVYVFSAGYILLFYIVWRICTYKFKNPVAGLLILFGLTLGIRELFLFTVTETHQCIVYSALFFAIIEYDFRKKQLKYFLACVAALFIMFTHPLGIFTIGFALLYYTIERKNIKDPLIWLVAVIMIVSSLVNMIHTEMLHEVSPYSQLKNPGSFWSSIFNSKALDFLKIHFTHFYWVPELVAVIVFAWLIIKKEWLKLALTSLSVIAYLIITFITFRNGDSSIMTERIFLPVFFMINLVFADLLIKQKTNTWIAASLIIFFLANGIHYINGGCLMYKKRVAYLDDLVQQGIAQGNDKYILTNAKADKEKILVPWAFGAETVIYSKYRYDRCVIFWNDEPACTDGNCRITTELCLPVNELNQTYFHLSPAKYIELK
jgi:hypothetical protein